MQTFSLLYTAAIYSSYTEGRLYDWMQASFSVLYSCYIHPKKKRPSLWHNVNLCLPQKWFSKFCFSYKMIFYKQTCSSTLASAPRIASQHWLLPMKWYLLHRNCSQHWPLHTSMAFNMCLNTRNAFQHFALDPKWYILHRDDSQHLHLHAKLVI